jgi:hypothetical protein
MECGELSVSFSSRSLMSMLHQKRAEYIAQQIMKKLWANA